MVFHDQLAHKRVPHLNDFFGFTMAALGEKVRLPTRSLTLAPTFFRFLLGLRARQPADEFWEAGGHVCGGWQVGSGSGHRA